MYAYTVEPVYYGHLVITNQYPDYQGIAINFLVSLYDKAPFGSVWTMQLSSVLINRLHCILSH